MVNLLQLHLAEHQQPPAQLFRVENCYILFDIAPLFQPLLSFKDGCRGQMHSVGQLFGGQFRVLLQRFQNLQVCFVYVFSHLFGIFFFYKGFRTPRLEHFFLK